MYLDRVSSLRNIDRGVATNTPKSVDPSTDIDFCSLRQDTDWLNAPSFVIFFSQKLIL